MNKENVVNVIKQATENLSSNFSEEQLDDFTVLTEESEYDLELGNFIAAVLHEAGEQAPSDEDIIFVAETLAENGWATFDSSSPSEREYAITAAREAMENSDENFSDKLISFVSSEIED